MTYYYRWFYQSEGQLHRILHSKLTDSEMAVSK